MTSACKRVLFLMPNLAGGGAERVVVTLLRHLGRSRFEPHLALVVFSHPLIRILFQRGAFTAADTGVVSRVQAFLSLQIPFYFLTILGVRLISALKRNWVLMVVSGVNMVLNIVFNLILMRYMGVAGIALSTSFVYLVACTLVYASIARSLWRRGRLEGVLEPPPTPSLTKEGS